MARHDDDDDDFDDDEDDRPIKKPRKRRSSSSGGCMVDFLVFRKMIGPTVLIGLYWLVVLGSIGLGLFIIVMAIIASRQAGPWAAVFGVLYGLAVIVIGPIVMRVYFELFVTMFRIY